jgi:hypothetical protein
MNIFWTQEEKDKAVSLWLSGMSADYVAAEMSYIFKRRFTKNSCLGMINRLSNRGEAPRRADYKAKKKVIRSASEKKSHKKKPPVLKATVAPIEKVSKPTTSRPSKPVLGKNVIAFTPRVSLDGRSGTTNVRIELATGCLYSTATNKDGVHLFCNATKRANSAYCPEHHARCYVSPLIRVLKPQFRLPS